MITDWKRSKDDASLKTFPKDSKVSWKVIRAFQITTNMLCKDYYLALLCNVSSLTKC